MGLFALSALYKPQVKESESEPVTEVIHATMIDTASLQAEANAIKKAKAAKAQAEKERLEARERAELEAKQAEAAAQAKAEAERQSKAEEAERVKEEAEAAARVKADAEKQAKAEAAKQAERTKWPLPTAAVEARTRKRPGGVALR